MVINKDAINSIQLQNKKTKVRIPVKNMERYQKPQEVETDIKMGDLTTKNDENILGSTRARIWHSRDDVTCLESVGFAQVCSDG